MGSGNAIRVTEPETFTLIQLEEERQKLKKKELLKNMLTDSEFSIQGQCAINLMMTKIDIINTFLLMKTGRNYAGSGEDQRPNRGPCCVRLCGRYLQGG